MTPASLPSSANLIFVDSLTCGKVNSLKYFSTRLRKNSPAADTPPPNTILDGFNVFPKFPQAKPK